MKERKETFGYIVYDEEFDKFWGLSEKEFKKFKIPSIEDYSRSEVYGTQNLDGSNLSSPISIGFMLTNKCNSKCLHCRASSGIKEKNEMDIKSIKKILKDFDKNKILRVVLSGGEPLMKEGIEEILEYALSETNLSLVLGTNGILLDKYSKLINKFSFIETSLDSVYPDKHDWFRNKRGAYYKLIENLGIIKDVVPFRIFTTLSKINLGEIRELSDLCYNLGAQEHEFLRYIPSGRGKKNAHKFKISNEEYKGALGIIKEISKKYKGKMAIESVDIKKNHEFNQAYTLVRPNGNLLTFSTYLDKEIPIGNLLEENISNLWSKSIINKRAHLKLWTMESI